MEASFKEPASVKSSVDHTATFALSPLKILELGSEVTTQLTSHRKKLDEMVNQVINEGIPQQLEVRTSVF